MSNYIPVIGLEIHVQLKTKSKMFSRCSADWFGKEPNTVVDPVTLGLPGALPVPNKKAIEQAILVGMALNCKIAKVSKFDRKHYFYPDLPKGYQISQYDQPLAVDGRIVIANEMKQSQGIATSLRQNGAPRNDQSLIRIKRVHLEEDTGKLIHEGGDTLVDFNRAGVPLLEIVTEPDFDSSDTVKYFLEELQVMMRYLGVSDADMEKGSMRLEPNISLREGTSDKLPAYKVEIKNINSFRFTKAAIDYELKRHQELLEKGETPVQETRGWDSVHKKTVSQRTKEGEADYRYFPEPDIPPMEFSEDMLAEVRKNLPELPQDRLQRFVSEYGIKYSDAFTITRNKKLSDYYEAVCKQIDDKQFVASVIVNKKLETSQSPQQFASLVSEMIKPKKTDLESLTAVVKEILNEDSQIITDFKAGKENVINVLIGAINRKVQGKAEVSDIIKELKKQLDQLE